jgi:hypothetical protein
MHGFFDVKTPRDLLQKLEREYERLRENPADADHAFNFFVTAEHIPDWIYNQDMPTRGTGRPDLLENKKPGDFKNTHTVLRICSHLANGGKHFHLDRHQSIERIGVEETGYAKPGYVKPGYFAKNPTLMVYLTSHEVTELQNAGVGMTGAKIEVPWLAKQVLEFWHKYWQGIQP